MTRKSLNEYILRRKSKAGTWRELADAVGVDFRILEGIARGRRNPNKEELKSLGVKETVRVSYSFE